MRLNNFATNHNIKTFSVIEYEKDLKFKALNEKLIKIRDKLDKFQPEFFKIVRI